MGNVDPKTVQSFGDEWQRFSQDALSREEALRIFSQYFSIFPWEKLGPDAEGFDMGCGTGRWAQFVAHRVAKLHCVDPSSALLVAEQKLKSFTNVQFHPASSDSVRIAPASQDFGYSLGVLHHVPDTAAAIKDCAVLLKPGAPLLLYLYYNFENRPGWFRALWRVSNMMRALIAVLPSRLKNLITDIVALLIYLPLARLARCLEGAGVGVRNFPLADYRTLSWYTMRTDARDRFGTPLEQRFSRQRISEMMHRAGLVNVRFSEHPPYWCAVGERGV